ncbi:MAG: DUF1249 domain-containing protein [Gammaproteobacteria bacterium]|nr:DUF1249 domain-containing protein [Gammaproteobacteria bacterium]MBA3730904.1 DUF1249 domain-containing protein [Gammaproteobacteria bacterium]
MLCRPPNHWIDAPRPRSFAALMEVYEANYMRLRKLYPQPYDVGQSAVSRVGGGLDLHLKIFARSSYTSTIHLTYYLKDHQGVIKPDPDLRLRIYHDARQAEVLNYSTCGIARLACNRWHRAHTTADLLVHKWAVNRFLYKWLSYVARQGHAFPEKAIANALEYS